MEKEPWNLSHDEFEEYLSSRFKGLSPGFCAQYTAQYEPQWVDKKLDEMDAAQKTAFLRHKKELEELRDKMEAAEEERERQREERRRQREAAKEERRRQREADEEERRRQHEERRRQREAAKEERRRQHEAAEEERERQHEAAQEERRRQHEAAQEERRKKFEAENGEKFFFQNRDCLERSDEEFLQTIKRFEENRWEYPYRLMCDVFKIYGAVKRCENILKEVGLPVVVHNPMKIVERPSDMKGTYRAVRASSSHVFLHFLKEVYSYQPPEKDDDEYTICANKIYSVMGTSEDTATVGDFLCFDGRLDEATRTSVLSVVFSEFLQVVKSEYFAVHQCQLLGTCRTDLGILHNDEAGLRTFVSCIEVKETRFEEKIIKQLLGYFAKAYKMFHKQKEFPVFVGMVISTSHIVVVGARVVDTLIESSPKSVVYQKDLEFCKLYTARLHDICSVRACLYGFVRTLDKVRLASSTDGSYLPSPIEGMVPVKSFNENVILLRNEVTGVQKVCKIYDYHGRDVDKYDRRGSNIKIMQLLGEKSLPGLELVKVDEDIELLLYDYINGSHFMGRDDFASICEDVHTLHINGIVHGDIRIANILCSKGATGGGAWLLDFDYSGRAEESTYSSGWTMLLERHHDANPCAKLEKIHDRHSLAVVYMVNFKWLFPKSHMLEEDGPLKMDEYDHDEVVKKLLDDKIPLKEIAESIRGAILEEKGKK